jgi:predicted outer membrane repeat protein
MNLKINDCTFIENEAPLGGAVQLCGFNIEFDNCKFNDNYASTYGGALNMEATTVTLKNSFLNGNIAEIDGGAVFTKGKN